MKRNLTILALALLVSAPPTFAADATGAPKETIFPSRPLGIALSIKMAGPYMEAADLQIIGLFKHKAGGDTYQAAAAETNGKLGGLLASLRDRGEFVGELGETILFTPVTGSIPARRFMVIGLGKEKDLSLDTLRVAGRIAAREAVRLQARHVAWAPVIHDQGNSTLEVGATDRAFVEQMLSAYDTEKRLQDQGLAPAFSIESFVIEAGPSYFDSAVRQVGAGITTILAALQERDSRPYRTNTR